MEFTTWAQLCSLHPFMAIREEYLDLTKIRSTLHFSLLEAHLQATHMQDSYLAAQ